MILVEFTEEERLVYATFTNKTLVTIDCNLQICYWNTSDLTQKLNPSEDELYVMRVKLVKPVRQMDLCANLKIFDHEYLLTDKTWCSLLSDYNTEKEDYAARLKAIFSTAQL